MSGTITSPNYDVLIEKIYDAALDPELWPETIEQIGNAFGSRVAGFFVQTVEQRLGANCMIGLSREELRIYDAEIAPLNPWFAIPGLMKPGRILTDQSLDVVHGQSNYFLQTKMYKGWYRSLGLRHSMGGTLASTDGSLFNFTFMRGSDVGHFSATEVTAFQILSRHLVKAINISERIGAERFRLHQQDLLLGKLDIGVIYLNAAQRITHKNMCAESILSQSHLINEVDSRFLLPDKNHARRLAAAIKRAFVEGKSSTLHFHDSNGAEMAITIIAANKSPSGFLQRSASVMVLIVDQQVKKECAPDYLRERWGLTKLEARFVNFLIQAKSISEIAGLLGLTANTARWYSKQIMSKVGVSRQSDLIIKLLNDLPVLF